MNGARDYCVIFKESEQVGRLYLVSSSHARGKTFSVYVLPKGEAVRENGGRNPPLNKDAIEVYGMVSGQRGWTESYGWIHEGPWMKDLAELFLQRQSEWIVQQEEIQSMREESATKKAIKIKTLLSSYDSNADE